MMRDDVGETSISKVSPRAWLSLAILVLFSALSFLDRQILSMMVDLIRRDLHIDDVQISMLMGLSFALVYAVLALVMGGFVDRYPRRLVIYAGVSLWSLATASCALATSFEGLFLSRMAVGIGEATLVPAAYSLLTDLYPRHRLSLAMAIFSVGMIVGAGVSMGFGGVLISYFSAQHSLVVPVLGTLSAWQAVFLAIGLPGLFLAMLAFTLSEPPRTGLPSAGANLSWQKVLWHLVERRQFWAAVFLSFAPSGVLANAVLLWGPAYFSRNFGWSPAQVGAAIGGVAAIAGGGGQLFAGWFVDRMFARGRQDAHFRYFGFTVFASIPVLVLAFLVPDPYFNLACLTVPFFLLFANTGYAAAIVQMTTPAEYRGRVGGIFVILIMLPGLVIGPSLVAMISTNLFGDQSGLGDSIAVCAVVLAPIMIYGAVLGQRVTSGPRHWGQRSKNRCTSASESV